MSTLLKSFLMSPVGVGLVGAALMSGFAWLVSKSVGWISSKPKLAALAPIAADAGDALTAAEKAAQADVLAGKANAALGDAARSALGIAKADLPGIEKAVENEVNVLVNGPAKLTLVTSGGATANLPDLSNKGIATLVVVLIIGGIALLGGSTALLVTGNGAQELSCIEQAINSNPVAVGNLVTGLSTGNAGTAVTSAEESFGPSLGKCILTDLWDDAKAALAQKAAAKANAAVVAPATEIKAAAQVESVKRGWYPPGVLKTQ